MRMRWIVATFTGALVACGEPRARPAVSATASSDTPRARPAASPPKPVQTSPTQLSNTPPRLGSNALFRRYPTLAERVPWTSLGQFPTPVERLDALGRELGLDLYVKRDDLSADAYGGGKPRKLEFLIGEAHARGVNRLVTWGAVGSNQAAAVAALGRPRGYQVTLLLLPQAASENVRENLLADFAWGAELYSVGSAAEAEARAARMAGPREAPQAYVIPMGGSSAVGNLGFVNAGLELDEQIREGILPEPALVYIAMGTMGSAVGLAIGLAAAERHARVVAVRASNTNTSTVTAFRRLYEDTVEYLTVRDPSFPRLVFDPGRVVLEASQLGGGYGVVTSESKAAVELARRTEGLLLETTYTGKTLAALAARARSSRAPSGGVPVLFWNTHNSRPLPTEGVRVSDLPPAFQAYFPDLPQHEAP